MLILFNDFIGLNFNNTQNQNTGGMFNNPNQNIGGNMFNQQQLYQGNLFNQQQQAIFGSNISVMTQDMLQTSNLKRIKF